MRTYGRVIPNILFPDVKAWTVVTTDFNGFNDSVWLTTLIQTIKLNLGESPFFANYGIPATQSVQFQVPPDLYIQRLYPQFSKYFMSLIVAKAPDSPDVDGRLSPTYNVSVMNQYGSILSVPVAT